MIRAKKAYILDGMKCKTKVAFFAYMALLLLSPAATICFATEESSLADQKAAAGIIHENLILSEDGKTVTGTVDKGITSAEIPQGVTSIAAKAFFHCENLRSIVIPEGVVTIGSWAFSHCRALSEVSLPKSLSRIEAGAFSWCDKLFFIEFPAKLTYIGANAFYSCASLKSVTLPKGIAKIRNSTFYGCLKLEEVIFPQSLTEIEENAFVNCAFKTVDFPPTLVQIGKSSFYHCPQLEKVSIPASVAEIGAKAFAHCPSLSKVEWSNHSWLKEVDADIFSKSPVYTNLNLPDSISLVNYNGPSQEEPVPPELQGEQEEVPSKKKK